MKIYSCGLENTVGGTKIAASFNEKSNILLDFGADFTIHTRYLDAFLNPRSFNYLIDSIKLGALPVPKGILKDIYRSDLYQKSENDLAALYDVKFNDKPLISHVLVSHAHADHVGMIEYLNEKIIPVMSPVTLKILQMFEKLFQSSSFLTGVLKYKPLYQTTSKGTRQYRPQTFERDVVSVPMNEWMDLEGTTLRIKAFYTDHSIPGATAFFVEDTKSKKKIIYTGDLRLHGPFKERVMAFINSAKEFHPDILINETTTLGHQLPFGENMDSEKEVQARFDRILHSHDGLVLFNTSERNTSRLHAIYSAAVNSKRTLVLSAKSYLLLNAIKDTPFDLGIDLENTDHVRVYLPRKQWGVYEGRDYSYNSDLIESLPDPSAKPNAKKYEQIDTSHPRAVRAGEIAVDPGRFVMQLRYFDLFELNDLKADGSTVYVLSQSLLDDPDSEQRWEQTKRWLKLYGIESIYSVHASGHIRPEDMQYMVNTIEPEAVMPIHSEYPELLAKLTDIPVIEGERI